ncbi:hypothetical protein RA280_24625 [Cupriavidus sp. CV2]|uniref:hypothetical protein n=1 Tax=Cupriavidus ulmosensis TaxID=3065913 RepID=UPI00296A94DE|nr:hypothetical protein [Cupriavidus sp. CV2]MDW3684879.1 hypothetical protein [Cupriavidus sp. CV2]
MENLEAEILRQTVLVLVEQISSLEAQVSALRTGFNLLLARSDLAEASIQDLFETHWMRDKLASKARETVSALLDERASNPDPQYEEYLTLGLAALLEAAGEPPPR